jgi:hypothetical protein
MRLRSKQLRLLRHPVRSLPRSTTARYSSPPARFLKVIFLSSTGPFISHPEDIVLRYPTLSIVCLLALASGCAHVTVVRPQGGERTDVVRPSLDPPVREGAYAVDAGGRAIEALESGSTLHVGAQALEPHTLYEFRATLDDDRMVSFARVTTDRAGNIEPFVLWYESGVVGCATRRLDAPNPEQFRFRSFDEAEAALAGRRLDVAAYPVRRDERVPGVRGEVPAETPASRFSVPVGRRRSPMVFPSDSTGCLVNARETGTTDMWVSGRNFTPGEELEIFVAPNQRAWYVGDRVRDVSGGGTGEAPERVRVRDDGTFSVRVWNRAAQFNGAFDIVAHRGREGGRVLGALDIVSFDRETAYVLFMYYPPGGPHMDLAGRPLGMNPYFEFADGFAETSDPVWGAVDPTYVPAGHPGGTFAAYYVVNHKSAMQWAMNPGLADVTPGIEIHQVKAGCVNGTDVIIWDTPLALGSYDVVVEFGSTAASSQGTFTGDGQYDPAVDFLDGAVQTGFQVARDPYQLGPFAIGHDSYSVDDYFPTMGGASNVDLRAVVRYPATAAGTGTPVAPGTHPIFVIEHGNHSICNTGEIDHTLCAPADRKKNHEGYMRLLDILASNGVIAVSVDAYDLTGWVPQWIPERGTLILKHLELWSHMHDASTFATYPDFFAGRFAGRIDFTRVSVSGHSRGGEASVAAYVLNGASPTPFSIGSVSSIAPVDGQSYVLPSVPYYVILPSADCDVSSLSGQRIYDRAGTGVAENATKSASYVYGANHNFFNTVWAADGDDCNPAARQDYIAAADQQELGEAYLAAFHRTQLLGEAVYDDMLRGGLTFPSTAGFKIYPVRHEGAHTRLISGGAPAGLVAGGGATLAAAANPSPHQTSVTRIGWPASAADVTYTVPAGQRDATGSEVLSFRVAQTTSASNPAGNNQDFTVELVGGGVTRAVYVGQFDVIPPRYPHPEGNVHTVMTTVRVPLHSFIMNNSGLTLNDVDTVRFRFFYPATGEIYVDDVEFSR